MNILLVNWQDPENPQSGGAEIHLFEIFGRLAAAGRQLIEQRYAWTSRAGEFERLYEDVIRERSGGLLSPAARR